MNGAQLIMQERERQIRDEGWSSEHDDEEHVPGDLALAAICYAAPERVFIRREYAAGISFEDAWPWDQMYDKRLEYGECRENPGNVPADPDTHTYEDRLDLLIKAGALLAAEIDRLHRNGFPEKDTP